MSDIPESAGGGLASAPGRLTEAGAAADELKTKMREAADTLDAAFDRAGQSVTRSLARAASDGKISLSELATAAVSVAGAISRTPTQDGKSTLGGDLAGGLAKALGSLFGGARAEGGPVTGGSAYLVGERGPEVFRPASAGSVEPMGAGGGVTVNVSVSGGGAPALLRSEAQVAAALARAVALGRR